MYMCMCTYRERKRGPRNSGRESQLQTSFRWSFGVNEQETRVEIKGNVFDWFKKNSLQAHLLDRLALPHLRPHLVEIDSLLHVVTRETWTFLSHHVTCRGNQTLGRCWSCRNSKYTPRQDTQPREKMYNTTTPLVERILVLGKGDGVSLPYLWSPCQRSLYLKGRENSQEQRRRPWPRNQWHLQLSRWRQWMHLNSWPHQSRSWP